jgi:tRNA A37 threonylcarbamoyladenosine synthetase subunit TsaC/SUA5/YrdC
MRKERTMDHLDIRGVRIPDSAIARELTQLIGS